MRDSNSKLALVRKGQDVTDSDRAPKLMVNNK